MLRGAWIWTVVVAAAPVIATGCGGSGGGNAPDAGDDQSDAAVDASLDADQRPVSIDDPAAVAGSRALFYAADGSLLADVDFASHHAESIVPAGGSVVTFTPQAALSAAITTYLGVKPGDHLGDVAPAMTTSQQVSFTIPSLSGATSYEISSPCGTFTGVTFTNVQLTCGATTDFHVRALLGTSTAGSFLVKNVQIASSIALTGSYVAPHSAMFTVANIPAAYTNVSISYQLMPRPLWGVRPDVESNAPPTAGTSTMTGVLPDININQSMLQWQLVDATLGQQQVSVGGVTTFSATGDASAWLVPWASAPAFDAATGTVSWTPTGAGSANAISIALFTRTTDGTGTYFQNRRLYAPYAGTSARFPRLPAAYDHYNPIASSPNLGLDVIAIRSFDPEATRAHPFDAAHQLPTTGTIAYAVNH